VTGCLFAAKYTQRCTLCEHDVLQKQKDFMANYACECPNQTPEPRSTYLRANNDAYLGLHFLAGRLSCDDALLRAPSSCMLAWRPLTEAAGRKCRSTLWNTKKSMGRGIYGPSRKGVLQQHGGVGKRERRNVSNRNY
jgi:hypothetical protein